MSDPTIEQLREWIENETAEVLCAEGALEAALADERDAASVAASAADRLDELRDSLAESKAELAKMIEERR